MAIGDDWRNRVNVEGVEKTQRAVAFRNQSLRRLTDDASNSRGLGPLEINHLDGTDSALLDERERSTITNPLFFYGSVLSIGDLAMNFFEGDLLSGDLALRNVQGMIASSRDREAATWSGHFRVSTENAPYLQLERNYLLMLDDGRSAQVVLSDWNHTEKDEILQVQFEPA